MNEPGVFAVSAQAAGSRDRGGLHSLALRRSRFQQVITFEHPSSANPSTIDMANEQRHRSDSLPSRPFPQVP